MMSKTTFADAIVTCICSYLSVFGSILVLMAYYVARTKSMPRAANLILHLASSDFIWFALSSVQSTFWLVNDGVVPGTLCYISSPTIIFMRMASLLWTCVISFNVLMSVQKRKWLWQGQEKAWQLYRRRYYIGILILATPAALLDIIKQNTADNSSSLGCSPEYEPLGLWYEVLFPELLPIFIGFLFNLYVYLQVRAKISKSAYPHSVRKRRLRIMYHYVIVCIVCWFPTVAAYFIEVIGYHSSIIEIIARLCLYASGFCNFLVFGMQDPHLKKAFLHILHSIGLIHMLMFLLSPSTFEYYFGGLGRKLKSRDVEKTVMFEDLSSSDTAIHHHSNSRTYNVNVPKDYNQSRKNRLHRNKKLSKDEKIDLYKSRPDLFYFPPSIENHKIKKMRQPIEIEEGLVHGSSGNSNSSTKEYCDDDAIVTNQQQQHNGGDNVILNILESPLLLNQEILDKYEIIENESRQIISKSANNNCNNNINSSSSSNNDNNNNNNNNNRYYCPPNNNDNDVESEFERLLPIGTVVNESQSNSCSETVESIGTAADDQDYDSDSSEDESDDEDHHIVEVLNNAIRISPQ